MIEADRLISAGTTLRKMWQIAPFALNYWKYVGQPQVRSQMEIFIKAAKLRGDALDHLLIFGPRGGGWVKLHLQYLSPMKWALIYARLLVRCWKRRAIWQQLLTNLEPHDVLFIDEIHRLSPVVEEVLYPAMKITNWIS